MDFRRLAGLDDVLEAGMRMGHDQVVIEGAGEEHGFLRDDAEGGAQFVGGQVADVFAVQIDLAFVGLVEAEQQFGQRALAAAAGAHEHGEVAGLEGQAEVFVEPGMVLGIAKGEMAEFDLAGAAVLSGGSQGMRLLRHVEDVAEAFDGDVGLLEFLPQADQAEHGLAHPAGEHLEGDEHADGEAFVLHDEERADDEDGERHDLFEAIGDDVVGVADLLGGEAGGEVLGQVVAVFLVDIGFHLQGFDGAHAGDVFGEEGLVARTEHELLVQFVAKQGGDEEADDGDGAEQPDGNQGELPAVGEHYRQEDEQEREIEDQGDGGTRDEFADGLHAVQAGDQGAGGTVFEVRQRQAQQVAKDLAAEDGVDAVAGVQHEVLAQPGHAAGEAHEHDQGDTEDDQGAVRLMDDDLVDDDLGEQRCSQTNQLDGQAGEQDVAPDGFVLEEFGQEPTEAEGFLLGFEAGNAFFLPGGFAGDEDEFGFELALGFVGAERFRGLRAGTEVEELVAVCFEDEDREGFDFRFGGVFRDGAQEGDGWQGKLLPVGGMGVLAGFEAKGAGGFVQGAEIVRWREILFDQLGIEGDAVEIAQAAE